MGRLVKSLGRVLPGEVWDARAEADALLRGARAEAERLVAEANAAADSIREQARLAGRAAGQAEAETAFTALQLSARAEAERVRAAAVPAARALAVRMAEKIVREVVRLDPAALVRIASEALAAARARSGLVLLRVHPDDLATLETARPDLVAAVGSTIDLRLVADADVGRAGCVVETPVGRLDARLTTQLQALEQAVYGNDPHAARGVPRG